MKLMKNVIKMGLVATTCCVLGTVPAVAEGGYDDGQVLDYYKTFEGKKVTFIVISAGIDNVQAITAGLREQSKELGYELTVKDTNWSNDQGAQAISQALIEKPDLLIVQNLDTTAYASLLRRATAQGVKVIQVIVKSTAATDGYVGPDWYALARKNMDAIAERCAPSNGGNGKFAVLQGTVNNPTNITMMAAVKDVMEAKPDLKMVSSATGDWDASKAHSVASTVLKQHPDLCGYLGPWDGMDVGIAAAIDEAKMKDTVFLATTGSAHASICPKIKDGSFDQYISFDAPYTVRAIGSAVTTVLQQGDLKAGAAPFTYYVAGQTITTKTFSPSVCWAVEDFKAYDWR